MAKKEFVIGMDGGGTKTAAQLADMKGNVLAEATNGPSNFQIIGVEQAAETMFSLVQACCKKVGCSIEEDVVAVAAGLAGAGRPSEQERVRQGLMECAKKQKSPLQHVLIESDARIALEGAFKGKAGIILIAGTGSIAFAKDHEGNVHRVGGWGRTLGDEGSGFSIAREGLNAVTKHLDGRGKPTLLTQLIAKKFDLSTQEKIIAAVYREGFDIPTIAPLVVEAAGKKDIEAARILNRATFELTEHIRALVIKIERASRARHKIPLAFIGGVITADSVYNKILKHKITFSLPQVTVVQPEASPTYGAVLLAIQSTKTTS